jgi:hypothetical protein
MGFSNTVSSQCNRYDHNRPGIVLDYYSESQTKRVSHPKGVAANKPGEGMATDCYFVRLKAAFVSPHVRMGFAKAASYKVVRRKAEGPPKPSF